MWQIKFLSELTCKLIVGFGPAKHQTTRTLHTGDDNTVAAGRSVMQPYDFTAEHAHIIIQQYCLISLIQ